MNAGCDAPRPIELRPYSLAGVELAATPTQGTFFGVAASFDDFATWTAVIEHDVLADVVPITGGVFALDGNARFLQGVITGGQVARLGGSCRRETFAVTGDVLLENGGSGEFGVTLTHYGRRIGGHCVTFFATVEGLITFTLPSP